MPAAFGQIAPPHCFTFIIDPIGFAFVTSKGSQLADALLAPKNRAEEPIGIGIDIATNLFALLVDA
ncbi:MAG: hypothetical protein MUC41_19720 [Syntrophobacteraceae bacterium]|nr:hypothetical protein [Syntrophobacteraceae bacterium]